MASLVLSGDTSGSITVAAPAVAGSNTQTLAAVTGTLAPIVSGTAVTASGTSVDFTSIPSWVKRITVMFSGLSTSGTSNIQIQLGDSGGIETSGYAGSCDSRTNSAFYTSGFLVTNGITAAATHNTLATIGLLGANTWCISGVKGSAATDAAMFFAGSKTLSDTLTQVRITTANGTDTFDAGSINLLWE